MTFAEGRAPLPTEESPEHDARVDEVHLLLPPMWQTVEAPFKEAIWLRPRGEAGTMLAEGDKDLESPPPLEPHLKQLLGEKEPSLVGAKVGDGLPPLLMSMPKDPEPSPLHQSVWIEWLARHVEMPPWWRELIKIPSYKDYQEFAQKVCATFEVPKVCNRVKRVDNYHTPIGTPFNWKIPFPAACQQEVWFSGLPTCPTTPYHCLCEGVTVLG